MNVPEESARRFIPVEESFRQWDEEAAFRAAYDALEAQFAQADTRIAALRDDLPARKPGASVTEPEGP